MPQGSGTDQKEARGVEKEMKPSFEEVVNSMAGLAGPKGGHPWWVMALAVQSVLKDADSADVVEKMEKVYDARMKIAKD